jgi:hypothetical protein
MPHQDGGDPDVLGEYTVINDERDSRRLPARIITPPAAVGMIHTPPRSCSPNTSTP